MTIYSPQVKLKDPLIHFQYIPCLKPFWSQESIYIYRVIAEIILCITILTFKKVKAFNDNMNLGKLSIFFLKIASAFLIDDVKK